jgi:hypothetical protein
MGVNTDPLHNSMKNRFVLKIPCWKIERTRILWKILYFLSEINIYSLKNIFIPKISKFLKIIIINVNVAKATKVLCSVFVLVDFCIQMTQKKSLCNRYKGFSLQKKW